MLSGYGDAARERQHPAEETELVPPNNPFVCVTAPS